MTEERIHILRDILLDLHHGASAESVQERFNQHFKGVSAIEISMMEYELMNSDTGITFEDVMDLCNVHANLFKGAISDVDVPDSEQEGHPVKVFKDENLALRAAVMRIRRIIDNYAKPENEEFRQDILKGLRHQFDLLGQFDNHYTRKEKLFFPIMEGYGHDAPPKVMWGVDDNIRELFKEAKLALVKLPEGSIEELSDKFEMFAAEFEEMIFKEEAILLMILLESFTQDDWLQIADESDAYGYAILKPTVKWQPQRESFGNETDAGKTTGNNTADALKQGAAADQSSSQSIIQTPEGQFTITFTPNESKAAVDRTIKQPFGNGYLSLEQANLILNHLPLEITFVNKDDIFQYYNDSVPAAEMIFKRTPSQIGRNVELCHPPKVLDKVKKVFEVLRSGQKDKVEMWFQSERLGKFVYVTYAAVRNEKGEFQGVLEYVQDIKPFFELDSDSNRDI
ncbi:DUF438 domain-containing protein [Streptococcus devriesei]|uniref:DUF438 domain-containing protein n=1 Tax=Streptococcus devriesei TaxID=231233 RepID=UPI00041DFF5B|nr:DUF438 domain-containing protein [Streptococcus devriesei]